MTLNEYQEKAMSTCLPTSDNFSYMMLNLVGEVGEFSSKVAKGIRKGECEIGSLDHQPKKREIKNELFFNTKLDEFMVQNNELMKEAGDILWQLSGLCEVMGWELEDVAKMNLDKLQCRKKEGTIDGNGDGVTKAERL